MKIRITLWILKIENKSNKLKIPAQILPIGIWKLSGFN